MEGLTVPSSVPPTAIWNPSGPESVISVSPRFVNRYKKAENSHRRGTEWIVDKNEAAGAAAAAVVAGE
jgi:hypothetical protein